jgi:hypothetical protein
MPGPKNQNLFFFRDCEFKLKDGQQSKNFKTTLPVLLLRKTWD